MTWNAVHTRADVLRSVVDEANRRRDGALPLDLPGVADTFDDAFALVTALQMRWHTRLAGLVEASLDADPTEAEDAVAAWRRAATDLAGVRAILDAQLADPATPELGTALRIAERKDLVLMAAMAGRPTPSTAAAVRVGRQLEDAARAGLAIAA